MCGILGFFGGKKPNLDFFNEILEITNHRGPDDSGVFSDDKVILGSNRLSIIDLSPKGKMPMKDSSGNFVIILNGEIYNYIELKKKFNILTKTNTDTEVLLELYKKIGIKCLDELNGMFAFAIYDLNKKKLFCARDPIGVKPFYYSLEGDNFCFSSEVKSINKFYKTKNINYDYIKKYLSYGLYDNNDETFFSSIKQLSPGSYIIKDNNNFYIKKYWDLKNIPKNNLNLEETCEKFNSLIDKSFRIQLRSDAKLGINVSSGLDSCLMMYNLNKINGGQGDITANSYFFGETLVDEKNDLSNFAEKINWKVNFVKITPEDIIKYSRDVMVSQEQPFPGIITYAKHILINKSYEKNRKVILEAQGGDDICVGYKYYFPFFIKDLIKEKKFLKAFSEISKFISREKMSFSNFFIFYKNSLTSIDKAGVSADGSKILKLDPMFETNFDNKNSLDLSNIQSQLNRIVYRDFTSAKLPRILRSCDRASMSSSKELRVPLLDKDIVEFCYATGNEHKVKNGSLRYFYRKTLLEKFKDSSIFKRKNYISDPQTIWLRTHLYDWAYSLLSNKNSFSRNFYDQKKTLTFLDNFKRNHKINNSFKIWQLINLELWKKYCIEEK
ncbi:asparagine synthase (glutamine-hydrolyzing) [Candidatus Pelagibacter bacterium]|nr:asparagine synthase (glutamine-hydrolyzing) [Candidatus Pelagibacter bacterium]